MVGCAEMKRPIAPAKAIMSATDTTIAATITGMSFTIPTAVMIESRENTRSTSMICMISAPKDARTATAAGLSSAPSSN